MTTLRKIILGTFVLIVATALAVAWRHQKRAGGLESEIAKLKTRRAARLADAATLGRQLADLEAECALLRANLTELGKAKPAVESAAKPAVAPVRSHMTIAERLQKEPDAQLLWLAKIRADSNQGYGALFRTLGLSAEQVRRFQDIVVRREEQSMDLEAIKHGQSLADSDPLVLKLRGKIEEEYTSAQRELLGPEGFKEFQDYGRTKWAREMVNGWAGGAALIIREPFTREQGEALVRIVANANDSYRNGRSFGGPIDWAKVDAEAKAILTEAQFSYIRTMEPPLPIGARFQAQLYDLVNRARSSETKGK